MFRKFIDWMKFHPPTALTLDGWRDFKIEFRKNAPVRFFFCERLIPWICSQGRKVKNAIWWVRYRTISRHHIINTGLTPGWHDVDHKMLYANFALLVDYVEKECAWMDVAFDEEKRGNALGWYDNFPSWTGIHSRWRSREHGLRYLDWEASLDDPSLSEYESSASQARKARIVKELYIWWKDVRPARRLPAEPDYMADSTGLHFLDPDWKKDNPEEAKAFSEWAENTHILEEAWAEEDTVMLMKLIKIRRGMWT